MNLGFLILSPNKNIAGLKNTLGSLDLYTYNRESVCVVGDNASNKEIKEMKLMCPTYKGDNTITSLVNKGMTKIKQDWICIVFGGSRVPYGIEHKFQKYCNKETEVIYPIVDFKCNFVEGSFNGVVINRHFFKKVGNFPSISLKKCPINDFEYSKLVWASQAANLGGTFKGVLGYKVI